VAKISVSLDDELLAELKSAAGDNVSAFISAAVRHQLRRRDLAAYLAELEEELGPPTEDELAEAAADFDRVDRANAALAKRRRRTA
jgi:Arc/MetJ-type ribon-helix-helix transcriptional regulator